jgi:hypothetical protein
MSATILYKSELALFGLNVVGEKGSHFPTKSEIKWIGLESQVMAFAEGPHPFLQFPFLVLLCITTTTIC